jgi:hypothetical protein
MALSLSTPGKCCGHSLNMHIGVGMEGVCSICPCVGFLPDSCYHGHEAGCEHMVDPFDRELSRAEVADLDRGVQSVTDTQVGGDHYKKFKIQPWQIWEEYDLNPWAANALKYLLRAGHKGPALEDLKKARHYLDYLIQREGGQ